MGLDDSPWNMGVSTPDLLRIVGLRVRSPQINIRRATRIVVSKDIAVSF